MTRVKDRVTYVSPNGLRSPARIIELRDYPHAETDLVTTSSSGKLIIKDTVRHKDFKRSGKSYWY
jgi:hypothetical protein